MSLANKYRPKSFEDVTEQKIIVDMLKSLCTSDELSCRNFLLIGPAGCGKAIADTEVILTSDGWKAAKDVKLGDILFTRKGRNTTVIGVYPQGKKPCYRLTFEGNDELSTIEVSEDHLNCVYLTDKKWYVPEITTSDLKLLFELGIPVYIDSVRNYSAEEDYKYSKDQYTAFQYAIDMFSLSLVCKYRKLCNVAYIGSRECTCFYVDDPDHTFLAGSMVPTHNTTLGRIMANVLNDNQGEPIELDAASHGSIDEVRNLIEQAKQYPIGQKYKVIIADEVHSFSNAAWQTLLLTLESGVGRAIWIMCTTNPEKIPATILSRVQTFQLSKISLEGIQNRLKYVIECENKEGAEITYEEDAVNYIAKLANGGMRDSLTLLDKALAYSKNLSSATITQALNLPEYDDFFKLLQAYAKKDNIAIAKLVDEVYNSGVNFVKWMESFHSFVMQVVKYILLQDINKTMIPTIYKDKISKYSSKHLIICLNLANKLLKMNQELKTTQYLQEVTLTHLCFLPKKEG